MNQKKKLTGVDYAIDELVSGNQAVVVLVHLAEEVCQTGLLVVHELEELVTNTFSHITFLI